MKLTETQRAFIVAAAKCDEKTMIVAEAIFLAGLRMGRAEGREQAAKACETRCGGCVDAIRALPRGADMTDASRSVL